MGEIIRSPHVRIITSLVNLISQQTNYIRASELDFNANTYNLPQEYNDSVYNIILLDSQERRSTPLLAMRFNFMYAISISNSENANNRYDLLQTAVDDIHRILQRPQTDYLLGVREVSIQSGIPAKRDNIITLTEQYYCLAIRRQKEY